LHSGKLSGVVKNAVDRWFLDALRNAKNGDANQAALLAEMLSSGYGCAKDEEEAKYWKQVARNGGARRVEGVYDELP
jgi:TPR repeat protein